VLEDTYHIITNTLKILLVLWFQSTCNAQGTHRYIV